MRQLVSLLRQRGERIESPDGQLAIFGTSQIGFDLDQPQLVPDRAHACPRFDRNGACSQRITARKMPMSASVEA
jgi:hypothetical protein